MKGFDVAVIGAGPAGLSTAIFLAGRGYSVAVLERRVFPRPKLCGDFLSPINWPLFHRLGIARDLLSADHDEIRAFRISAHGGEEASCRLPVANGGALTGLGLPREIFDHILLKRAENAGVVVRQGIPLREILPEQEGWSLMFERDGAEEQLSARFLVGADGRNSWVAQRLGLGAPAAGSSVVAFQLHLGGVKKIRREVQVHLFPGGYAGLVGVGNGVANLCFAVETNQLKKARSMEKLLEQHLYRNGRLRDAVEGAERLGKARSIYPVFSLPRRSYGRGFLLVGDAARVTEPVTGEGVYFALKGGELAAHAIDRAFTRGDFSARELAVYERSCRSAFSLRIRMNRMIRVLVYRPALAGPLIAFSSRTSLPLFPLVRLLCRTDPAAF